jgi:hypothetical protein
MRYPWVCRSLILSTIGEAPSVHREHTSSMAHHSNVRTTLSEVCILVGTGGREVHAVLMSTGREVCGLVMSTGRSSCSADEHWEEVRVVLMSTGGDVRELAMSTGGEVRAVLTSTGGEVRVAIQECFCCTASASSNVRL